MGNDPRSTRQSREAARRLGVERPSILPGGEAATPTVQPEVASSAVARALMPFLLRDDGWLRIVPQEDGATVYYKWKWTAGKHVNHYVMAVYPASECAEALRRLAAKVDAVDSGVQPPVKDHYFKGEGR